MAEQSNFDWSAASETFEADFPKHNVLFCITCSSCDKQLSIRSYSITLCTFDNGIATYQFSCPNCCVLNLVLADESMQKTLKDLDDVAELAISVPSECYDSVRAKKLPISEDEFFQFCRRLSVCIDLAEVARGK